MNSQTYLDFNNNNQNNNSNSNSNNNSPKSKTQNSNDNKNSYNYKNDKNINLSNIIHGCQEKGAKSFQEDSYCTFLSPDLSVIMLSVFDGHGGQNGQVASQTASKITKQWFQNNYTKFHSWNNEKWEQVLIDLFTYLHKQIRENFIQLEKQRRNNLNLPNSSVCDNKGVVRKSNGLPVHGGTTCTITTALRMSNNTWQIICANTGDSDAILLARKPTTLNEMGGKPKNIHLSVDHSPDSKDEYIRIRDLPSDKYPKKLMFVYDQANVCRKFECPVVFNKDGTKVPKYVNNPWGHNLRPTNVRYDPAVYAVSPYGVQSDVTCIAMTRSLGDFYGHQFGLSYKPSVTFNNLDFNNEYIITVGSDGIWDCWKWNDWTDYVNGVTTKLNNNIQKVTKTVLKHTVARAKSCFGETSFDDASILLLYLRPQNFPKKELIFKNINNDNNTNNNNNNNNNNNTNSKHTDDVKTDSSSPEKTSNNNDTTTNNNNNDKKDEQGDTNMQEKKN